MTAYFCQDRSPCSAANPLPDDSVKSHQAFDVDQVFASERRYSDAEARFSLPSGKSIVLTAATAVSNRAQWQRTPRLLGRAARSRRETSTMHQLPPPHSCGRATESR